MTGTPNSTAEGREGSSDRYSGRSEASGRDDVSTATTDLYNEPWPTEWRNRADRRAAARKARRSR